MRISSARDACCPRPRGNRPASPRNPRRPPKAIDEKGGNIVELTGRLSIKALSTWLPEGRSRAADMIAAGILDERDAENMGIEEIPVVTDSAAAPDMAIRAALKALADAGRGAEELGILCHAWLYHQGYDMWSPAHYVANEVGASNALPFGIQAMSNGGAIALQTVAGYLLADPRIRTGLATTSDAFREPGFLRWNSMGSVVFGDGATAALVGRTGDGPDLYRLRSIVSSTAAELEGMYRMGVDPTPAPLWGGEPIRTRAGQQDFLHKIGIDRFRDISNANVSGALNQALEEAGLEVDDPRIKLCVLSRVGNRLLDLIYTPVLNARLSVEFLRLNAKTGHLGTGDALANLHDVRKLGKVGPGDVIINLTGGGGFTWSCIIAEVPEDAG